MCVFDLQSLLLTVRGICKYDDRFQLDIISQNLRDLLGNYSKSYDQSFEVDLAPESRFLFSNF